MKKIKLLLFLLSAIATNAVSQESTHWEFDLNFGYQFHLNKNGDKFIKLHDDQDEGIYQYGISIKRDLIRSGNFNLLAGIGYSKERVLPRIEVNHCYEYEELCPYVLITKRYYAVDLLQLPIKLEYLITQHLSVNLDIFNNIRFHQNFSTKESPKYLFELHSIEFYPELEYKFKRINIGLGYRLLNLKRIDPIYVYEYDVLQDNPEYYDKFFETYNPTKLLLSIGFRL